MLPIVAGAVAGAGINAGSSLVSNAMKFGHIYYQNKLDMEKMTHGFNIAKDYLQFSNARQLEFNRKNFEQNLGLMSKYGINPALAGGQFSTGWVARN